MRLCLGFAAAFLLGSLGCSPQLAEPRGCASHADCGSGALCSEGSCATSRPPVARVAEPTGPALSHVRVRFDGSGSGDPDPGDRVAAYAWRARAAGAPCEPVHTSGADAAFELLTLCAGTFEVGLTVRDSVGVASAEVVVPVELFAHPAPPSASLPAGPVLLEHRCAGAPLRCTSLDESGAETFALQATATSPAPGPFAWRWSARPPEALATAARITFAPPDGPNPTISIATDGTAIAGTYRFAVEATDSLGVVATAQVEVIVGNRPPAAQVAGSALSIAHTFLASPARFVAEGGVPAFEVVDPDGDPLTTRYTAEESGVAAPSMTVAPVGTAASFTIVVPASDPGSLLGPGVGRLLRFRAEDGNGGAAEVGWPVEVQNRPPRRVGAFATAASHDFDAAAARYRSGFALAEYADDDGDPLTASASIGDGACAALAFSGYQLRADCSVPYLGTPAASSIAGIHAFQVVVGDPWSALASESAAVAISNGGPTLSAPDVAVRCTRGSCCDFDVETGACLLYTWSCPLAEGSATLTVADPDGDPVALTQNGSLPGTSVCLAGACDIPVSYSVASSSTCGRGFPAAALQASVSDGLATETLAIPLRK